MHASITPTDEQVFFADDEIIVSKTDLKGRIVYANQTFCKVASFAEHEVVGQPHSIIRHPDMPRAIFKLLWDTLRAEREIFAYVKNITKTGAYYWVFAHVTPSRDKSGAVVGYHSNRRTPRQDVIANVIAPLYAQILREEKAHRNGQQALAAGSSAVDGFLRSRNVTYDELVFSL